VWGHDRSIPINASIRRTAASAATRRWGAFAHSCTPAFDVDADTPVVMGQPQDLTTGAVFQVSGQLDAARILSADRIVILTGYITVQ
jgi:hypothetical protein